MINFINTCPLDFLKAFYHYDCAFKAQKWCAERGVRVEVSEELAEWMEENACLVNDTWAERDRATRNTNTTTTRQKRRVVRIAILADGTPVEEVSWV